MHRYEHAPYYAGRRFIGVLFIIVTAACSNGAARGGIDPAELVVTSHDSAGVRVVVLQDPARAALPEWRVDAQPLLGIGEEAGQPAYELHRAIGAVRLPDGGVAIANAGTNEIRMYDAAGRHLRSMGRAGAGPGEFAQIGWIGALADTIVVFDVQQRRLTWFAPDGTLLHTQPLAAAGGGGFPEPIGMLGRAFVARSGFDRVFGRGERRDTIALYRYAADGTVEDSIGRYPGAERFFHQGGDFATQFAPIFGRDGYAHVAGGRVVFGASDSYAFDVHDAGGPVLRVRAEQAARSPAPADIEREREARAPSGPSSLPPQIQASIRQAVPLIPVRETLPAFAALRIDADGAVWVRDYTGAGPGTGWTVHGSDGVPAARVELPDGFAPYQIGRDFVLGRATNSDGVERILVLGLTRG